MRMHICCSICREPYNFSCNVSVTSCGHLYHSECIFTWYNTQKTCPQCREHISVLPHRVYFDVQRVDESADPELQIESDYNDEELQRVKRKVAKYKTLSSNLKNEVSELKSNLEESKSEAELLKRRIEDLSKNFVIIEKLETDNQNLKSELDSLKGLSEFISDNGDKTREMLRTTPVSETSVRQLCLLVLALKDLMKRSDDGHFSEITDLRKELKKLNKKVTDLSKVRDNLLKAAKRSTSQGNTSNHSKSEKQRKRSHTEANGSGTNKSSKKDNAHGKQRRKSDGQTHPENNTNNSDFNSDDVHLLFPSCSHINFKVHNNLQHDQGEQSQCQASGSSPNLKFNKYHQRSKFFDSFDNN